MTGHAGYPHNLDLIAPSDFEWDQTKAASNLKKHGVPFEAAPDVFCDVNRLDERDDRQSYGEERRSVTGLVDGVCICVAYTMRGDVCRVISVRPASRKERQRYGHRS